MALTPATVTAHPDASAAGQQSNSASAVAEPFFGRLKGGCTSLRHDARRQEARDAVTTYIELFYNSKR
jgi:transposase InsO family protein